MPPKLGRFELTVDEATIYRGGPAIGTLEPYVVVEYGAQTEQTISRKEKGGRVKWGHRLEFKTEHATRMELKVYQSNTISLNYIIGTASLSLEDLVDAGVASGYETQMKLLKGLKQVGNLKVQVSYTPPATKPGSPQHAPPPAPAPQPRPVIIVAPPPPSPPAPQPRPAVIVPPPQPAAAAHLHCPPVYLHTNLHTNPAVPTYQPTYEPAAYAPPPPPAGAYYAAPPGGHYSGAGYASSGASSHHLHVCYDSQHRHERAGAHLHHHSGPVPAYCWNQPAETSTASSTSYAPSAPRAL
ncbi:hypothetical protein CBR_g51509 [Chara braunii]|uniref:C2 domain-containing protein n=1 Tax=Chara braunii TaxID=69332 RepID=A0A388K6H6_CHABU|nr:hypothetical protein CBR_g51509 [Chara braunii]|eukprot:GBG65626.1 hypothetical protein CBR_g51509 [Chara braunii]